jgi:hypothetical protein
MTLRIVMFVPVKSNVIQGDWVGMGDFMVARSAPMTSITMLDCAHTEFAGMQ